ncbi:DeSI protein [Spatholobus suberectus]|nr:DeSI protein [Spatholobus suberectus]
MAEVTLHIYDVANGSERTNRNVVRINNILYGIGLGGIFHSTVQVYGDDEWSFGICEEGTGVFSYPAGMNTMYNYRKSLVLGKTKFNAFQVNQIVRELSKEWPGNSYDLLSKNCNHFCEEFCARLGVPKLPGWVNRFANAVDAAREGAENTASRVSSGEPKQIFNQQAKLHSGSSLALQVMLVLNHLVVQNLGLGVRLSLSNKQETNVTGQCDQNVGFFVLYLYVVVE